MDSEYDKEHPYYLLRFRRCPKTELVTRIDRYYIIRFWLQDGKRQQEHLFYPSDFGKAEIEEYRYLISKGKEHQINIGIDKARRLVEMLNQLEQFGNGNPCVTATEPVKPFAAKTFRKAKKLKRNAKRLKR